MNYAMNPYSGLMHSGDFAGFMHSTDFALRGIGMGVDQAMQNPVVKVAVFGLAAYGAACVLGIAHPKPARRRRNPRRRKRRKKARRR
jgi:hypothetical protein